MSKSIMSQTRTRKPLPAAAGGDVRGPAATAHEDSAKIQQPQLNQQNKSRSKIPKSIRNDLENALIGLCDVWFDEIKPHLLRNNIKVHIQNKDGAGDQQHERGVPGCSHLNPGAASDRLRRQVASCADCSSTQRMASKAPSRKQKRLSFKLLSPIVSSVDSLTPKKPPKKKEIPPPVPVQPRRRRAESPLPQEEVQLPQNNRRMPRPRSYSLSPHLTHNANLSPNSNTVKFCSPSPLNNKFVPSKKCNNVEKIRNLCRNRKMQSTRGTKRTRTTATQTYWTCNNKLDEISPCYPQKEKYAPRSHIEKARNSLSLDRLMYNPFCNKCRDRRKTRQLSTTKKSQVQSQSDIEATYECCKALSPERRKKASKTVKGQFRTSRAKGSSKRSHQEFYISTTPQPHTSPKVEMPPLFPDDLIEIIGDKYDRRIGLLYRPSKREEYSSTMNLFPITRKRSINKMPPWR